MTSVPHQTAAPGVHAEDLAENTQRLSSAEIHVQSSVLGERGGVIFLLGVPAVICLFILLIATIGAM